MLHHKNILLISPQQWGTMFLSKHHYAIELSKKQNKVFFLNIQYDKLLPGQVTISSIKGYENLYHVKFRPFFPHFVRFKFSKLYARLIALQIKWIQKKIAHPIDLLWDFSNGEVFPDLQLFDAHFRIYQPVDVVSQNIETHTKGADIIVSISQAILDSFPDVFIPKVLINHGLGNIFKQQAEQLLVNGQQDKKNKNGPAIGYIGNLLIHCMDRKNLKKIIEEYPNVAFHFFGSYQSKNNNLGGAQGEQFVKYLQEKSNVSLHGSKPHKELVQAIENLDGFVLCYKNNKYYKGDNSHKVLEYLSTGKVIISTHLSTYKNADLFEMLDNHDNSNFSQLFDNVISNLHFYNSWEKRQKRLKFALNNSYQKQIERIGKAIEKIYI